MNTLDKAEDLRQQAIALLLDERKRIDESLAQLGHNDEQKSPGKRRGRPPKRQEEDPAPSADHSEMTQ